MRARPVSVFLTGFDDATGLDTGVSHALLDQVADGELGETFRISIPGRVVAFGKRDAVSAGFDRAVEIVRGRGYAPVVRLPGGRAAVFHEQTVSFSWTVPIDDRFTGSGARFGAVAALIVRALDLLGVPSAVGEVPGEYCPGAFSVNHANRIKLAGIGQRVVRGAAHVGGVLVVGGSSMVADVLIPVYEALDLSMNPATIGAVEDVAPGVGAEEVASAVLTAVSEAADVTAREPAPSTMDRARILSRLHVPGSTNLA
jgi:lipoate-protein ligase A